MRGFLARFGTALAAACCLAAVPSTQTSSAPDRVTTPLTSVPTGNIGAIVPTALVSPLDGLPAVLLRGNYYQLTVHVWVAGRQPKTFATIALAGADRSSCVAKTVPAGTIATLRCAVVPTRIGVTGLRVSVLVAAANGVPLVATFDHAVVATGSSE
jgi:hypothetical protein